MYTVLTLSQPKLPLIGITARENLVRVCAEKRVSPPSANISHPILLQACQFLRAGIVLQSGRTLPHANTKGPVETLSPGESPPL